jgi:hypothetical protein
MNVDRYHWLLERAEEAASDGLSLKDALSAVQDGYSSIEADREFAQWENLPLTDTVEGIVAMALQTLQRVDGLDRDESYLLARLERGEKLSEL